MGLGPNKTSILNRIAGFSLPDMSEDQQREWVQRMQIDRTAARALGGMKRKAKTPKVPKPRRHKNHCYCTAPVWEKVDGLAQSQGSLICCRCTGSKCVKPPPTKRVKKAKP